MVTYITKANVSKLLGILINIKTDWSDHVDYIYTKACKNCSFYEN